MLKVSGRPAATATRSARAPVAGRYLSFRDGLVLTFRNMGLPLSPFSPDGHELVSSPDFLPDDLSYAGTLVSETPYYEFAREYLQSAAFSYENTRYYELGIRGHLPRPVNGQRAATAQCKRFLHLINKMRREGYRPEAYSPITMTRCTDGRLVVLDGKHRLAILLVLGVPQFPVAFCPENEVRAAFALSPVHGYYIEGVSPKAYYRKSFGLLDSLGSPDEYDQEAIRTVIRGIKNAHLETWANVYHPIPFDEFRNLTTQVPPRCCYNRLGMILDRFRDLQGAHVLDIGCNVGFYSFSLARRGAQVEGIDVRPEYIDIAGDVARIYRTPVEFIRGSATGYLLNGSPRAYDLVLCFSTLQWVIDGEGFEAGVRLLGAISEASGALMFDISVNRGKACLTCPPGEEIAFVDELLHQHTGFEHIDYVGDVWPYSSGVRHQFYCHH